MNVRLIEPEAPSLHLWSPLRYPRLGLPMIGAALKRAGHDVRIYCACVAPIDWDDVASADLVGHLVDHLDGARRLRARRAAARARRAHRDRRLARDVRRRRGARARRLRGARRGRRGAHARADRRPAGRPRARHDRRPVVQPRRPPRAQRAARAGRRPRRAAGARPQADRRPQAAQVDAHHDELGLPVCLQLLLGDGDVRPQVPLPQPRGGGRRARRQTAPATSSSTTTTSPPTSAA